MSRFLELLDGVWTATTRIAVLFAIVAVAAVICRDIAADTLVIETISVPRILARQGLGPDTIAELLRSELELLETNAGTTMRSPSVSATAGGLTAPDVVVPGMGVTASSLSTWIGTHVLTDSWRRFLHLPERRAATGEIRQIGDSFRLTVRLNNKSIYESPSSFGEDAIDHELRMAAIELAKQTFPYIYASYLYETAHEGYSPLRSLLAWIIQTLPETNENVIRAHNLRALLLQDELDYADAAGEFAWADGLARKAGMPDDYIIVNLAGALALAAQADWKLKALSNDQYQQRLERARGLLAAAEWDSRAHLLLGEIDAQEAMIATAEPAASADLAAAEREFSIAASLPNPDKSVFELHAEVVEQEVQSDDHEPFNTNAIIADRRRYLGEAAKSNHHDEGLLIVYKGLATALIREEAEVEVHGPNPQATGAIVTEIVVNPMDSLISPVLADTVDSSTGARLQRRAILTEACDALAAALHLWNAGNYEGGPDIIHDLALVSERARKVDPAARPCLASPKPAPQDISDTQ